MSKQLTSYELSRAFYDFSFENPHRIKPYHSAIYFFAIEHCNRLGWKTIFGFPTSMVLETIGMKSYNSYKKYFDELVDFGFIKVHEYSKNQYSSNIIELSFNVKAHVKALDKALIKHTSKQSESTVQSTSESKCSIDKQYNKEPINQLNNITTNKKEGLKINLENDFLIKISEFFYQDSQILKEKVCKTLNVFFEIEKFENFKTQTLAYIEFKNLSGERVHAWQSYLLEWQNTNWESKLKNEKSKEKISPQKKSRLDEFVNS